MLENLMKSFYDFASFKKNLLPLTYFQALNNIN